MMSVGRAVMNRVSGLEAKSIAATAMITAAIMTGSSSTMPTAVMTESSENTMSSTTICPMIGQKAACLALAVLVAALERLVDLGGRLDEEEHAADDQDHVAPEISKRQKFRMGVVRDITRDARKQPETHDEREREADHPGAVALLRRQLVGQDCYEDQVVNAEDDLQNDERESPTQTAGSEIHSMDYLGE